MTNTGIQSSQQVTDSQYDIIRLKGVGPRIAMRLEKLAIRTVQDVLFHLPLRYEDRTRVVPLGSLRPGAQAVIEADIDLAEIAFGRKRMLLCRISDNTGSLLLRFFHFSAAQKNQMQRGIRIRCYGEIRPGKKGLEMIHPEYTILNDEVVTDVEQTLTPIYPTTEGVHQLKLRDLTDQALALLDGGDVTLQEWLPASLTKKMNWPSLRDAIITLHRPLPDMELDSLIEGKHPLQQRLAFEELLAHHLSLRQLRFRARHHHAPSLPAAGFYATQFRGSLPFTLTTAQQRVIDQIEEDLNQHRPMMRLLQGDVGSGKTVVAACAMLAAVDAGYQAVLMAPTEILAEQHLQTFQGWMEQLDIQVAWLSGKIKGKARAAVLEQIASGAAQLVIGTHALFQEQVDFHNLALVVVDEQHRFGVHQRLSLREKGRQGEQRPHQLIMTATPIPRTLTMTAYADLDCSIIDELPPGRTPVQTVVLPETRRAEVVERVHTACAGGSQIYWVCTLIDESEVLQCQAAAETAEQLQQALPGLRVGLVHGRLKPAEKEQVMARFKAAELDLLVATTVIEVGVDVPNASLMVIENAERLGLSQLHQLRGRVGRGSRQSHCVLMYRAPLSRTARSRLAIMRETNDGFVIAQRDLEIRGPGEVLGTRQTGDMNLRMADLLRDQALLPQVQQLSEQLIQQQPQAVNAIIRRWLASGTRYGDV